MQAGLPKWRNALILRNALTILLPSTQFASFHSTPTSCVKWKSSCKSKALKDFLYRSGCSTVSFQEVKRKQEPPKHEKPTRKAKDTGYWDKEPSGYSRSFSKDAQSKFAARHAKKARQKSRKLRREGFLEDPDDDPVTFFRGKRGKRSFFWSFKSRGESSSRSSTAGFEWKEQSHWKQHKRHEWVSDDESHSRALGSCSDRVALGLPPKGPLKLEDIKIAFRSSAFKWHPDKHQGPSQVMANEKFKLCVDAYKSLRNAFPSA